MIKIGELKSPSTVQSSARVLYEAEVITREKDRYYISNRLFSSYNPSSSIIRFIPAYSPRVQSTNLMSTQTHLL